MDIKLKIINRDTHCITLDFLGQDIIAICWKEFWVKMIGIIYMNGKRIDLSSIDILQPKAYVIPDEIYLIQFFEQLKSQIILAILWATKEDEIYKDIDLLWLTERTRNALKKNGILYIESLTRVKKNRLLFMKWIWKNAIEEIELKLWEIWQSLA